MTDYTKLAHTDKESRTEVEQAYRGYYDWEAKSDARINEEMGHLAAEGDDVRAEMTNRL